MNFRPIAFLPLALGLVLMLAGFAPLLHKDLPPAVVTPSVPVPVPSSQLMDSFQPEAVLDELDKDVTAAGGDLNTQSVRLAVGFATGGFGSDLIAQRAMSDTGEQLLHLLRRGDSVSLFGFEKQVGPALWNMPFDPSSTTPLETVWGRLRPGLGGIDFNQAIITAISHLQPQANQNTIIVLITPWDRSEEARSDVVARFADLSPILLQKAALRRLPPFRIPYHQKDGNQSRDVFVTFLIPVRFQGLPMSGTRISSLQSQNVAPISLTEPSLPSPPPPPPADIPVHRADSRLIILGFICLLATAFLLIIPPAARKSLTIIVRRPASGGTRRFSEPWKQGEIICRIVGPDIPTKGIPDILLGELPPVILAVLTMDKGAVTVTSDYAVRDTSGQEASKAGLRLVPRQPQKLKIEGNKRVQSELQPVAFVVEMEVAIE